MATLISILTTFNIIGSATGYTIGLVSYNWILVFMNTFIKPIVSTILKKDIDNISITFLSTKFNNNEQ